MSYMRDARSRRLDSIEIPAAADRGNIATRLFGGRMGTRDLAALTTFQVTMEAQGDFDAVRPIFATTESSFSRGARLVSAQALTDRSDLNGSAGTWTSGRKANLTRIYYTTAPGGTGRIGYTTTDWIPVASLPRTDNGTKPLLAIRAVFSTTTGLPVVGNGIDDFTNWATRTDGRLWAMRSQAVDGVGTPTNFTSTTNESQSPIVGLQYLHRGNVVTVMGVGDSITDGRGTYLGEGLIMPAVEQITSNDLAVEYANAGWSGQTASVFDERAIDILNSDVMRPDVLVIPAGSPNDPGNSAITDAHVTSWRSGRARIQAAARKAGVPVVVWTVLPVNSAVNNWGTSDAKRVTYNAEVMAHAGQGTTVVDLATAYSGPPASGQVQIATGLTTDGIHPNDAGNAALAALLAPALTEAIGRVGGNKPAHAEVAAFPSFLITDADAHITQSGTWVYANANAAGAWTMPSLTVARPDAQVYVIKCREGAKPLTLSGAGVAFYAPSGTAVASLTLQQGQACLITNGGSSYDVHFLTSAKTSRGATADRPAANSVGVGATFYDSTLGKPIWSDGTTWKDATGTAV